MLASLAFSERCGEKPLGGLVKERHAQSSMGLGLLNFSVSRWIGVAVVRYTRSTEEQKECECVCTYLI